MNRTGAKSIGAGLVLTAMSLLACRANITAPDPLVFPETRSALDLVVPLPRLDEVVGGARPEVQDLVTQWAASWDYGIPRGRRIREALYDQVRTRVPDVSRSVARSLLDLVRSALAEARAVPGPLPLHLALPVSEAAHRLADAEKAYSLQDWTGSALMAMRGADALRETLPRTVALSLLHAAEEALAPFESGNGTQLHLRSWRLVFGARKAIESGDLARAVQRAYYACRLLGVFLP